MYRRILFLFLCFGHGFAQTFYYFGSKEFYFSPEENKLVSSKQEAEEECLKMMSQLVVITRYEDFQFIESHLRRASFETPSK